MLILIVTVHAAPTDTEVGGPIISDTTWTLANSPYVVSSNVQVMTGVTLTIEPGVVVKFNTDKLLQVDGTLIARGTAASPITFTYNQPSQQPGGWGNIEFTDSSVDATFDDDGNYVSGSILQYCIVEYGGSDVDSAIHASDSAPFIDHCTVRNNDSRGIYVDNDSPKKVAHNTVTDNNSSGDGGGIYVAGTPNLELSWKATAPISDCIGPTDGSGNIWYNVDFDDSTWQTVTLPDNNSIGANEDRFYRTHFDLYVVGCTTLSFSSDDGIRIYVNGSFVGHWGGECHQGSTASSSVEISEFLTTGDNVIAVHMSNGPGDSEFNMSVMPASSSQILGNVVSDNTASSGGDISGGGIFAESSIVIGNTVSNNSASGWYRTGRGGGICATACSTVNSNTV